MVIPMEVKIVRLVEVILLKRNMHVPRLTVAEEIMFYQAEDVVDLRCVDVVVAEHISVVEAKKKA